MGGELCWLRWRKRLQRMARRVRMGGELRLLRIGRRVQSSECNGRPGMFLAIRWTNNDANINCDDHSDDINHRDYP